jgi:hypothetical protein
MKLLRVIIPVLVTAGLTVLCILVARWLTGMVPAGEWAELLKATIIVFVVASALVTVAWSAYFTYIIRNSLKR